MPAKRRYTERESVTENERLQIIGLAALARHHRESLDDIERTVLDLVEEIGDPWTPNNGERAGVGAGGHTSDLLSSPDSDDPVRAVDAFLRKLSLEVIASRPSPTASPTADAPPAGAQRSTAA